MVRDVPVPPGDRNLYLYFSIEHAMVINTEWPFLAVFF